MASHVTDNYCVLGLGRTGASVARWLLSHKDPADSRVWVFAGAGSSETEASRALAELGARVVYGTEEAALAVTDGDHAFDLAIVSPGIPPHSAFFQSAQAASAELIGEEELAWRVSPGRWVAITGTNGKTTTTSLMCHLLQAAGEQARTVGNIGTPAIECVDERAEGEWFVAELSSFQLETSRELRPQTACLLNITPDHIGWHGSMDAYAAAKERVFQRFEPGDLAVVSEEDAYCRAICARLEARGIRVCRVNVHAEPATAEAAFLRDDTLVVRRKGAEVAVCATSELVIRGEHNVQNALAASAMALELGLDVAALRAGLRSFAPLEHRIEPCGELAGVHFVNDSKATNTDSVEKALTAFEPGRVVILLGGRDKGTDLSSLTEAVVACCHAAVCLGEGGPRFAEALVAKHAEGLEVVEAPHLAEALDAAIGLAQPGDTVLLSPACASFDEFSSFEERGRIFKRLVAERIASEEQR